MLPIPQADLEVIAMAPPAKWTPVTRRQWSFPVPTSETRGSEAPLTLDLKSGFMVFSMPPSSDADPGLPETADLSSEGSP